MNSDDIYYSPSIHHLLTLDNQNSSGVLSPPSWNHRCQMCQVRPKTEVREGLLARNFRSLLDPVRTTWGLRYQQMRACHLKPAKRRENAICLIKSDIIRILVQQQILPLRLMFFALGQSSGFAENTRPHCIRADTKGLCSRGIWWEQM